MLNKNDFEASDDVLDTLEEGLSFSNVTDRFEKGMDCSDVWCLNALTGRH